MWLSEMKEGQSATIVHIGGNGNLRRRILEMGILKGTIVKGYHVSLRVKEAAKVEVNNVR